MSILSTLTRINPNGNKGCKRKPPSALGRELMGEEEKEVRSGEGQKNPHRPISRLGSLRKFALHPLIHTLLIFTLAQDIEKKKSGASDSAVFFAFYEDEYFTSPDIPMSCHYQ